jgi:hypothetical protein
MKNYIFFFSFCFLICGLWIEYCVYFFVTPRGQLDPFDLHRPARRTWSGQLGIVTVTSIMYCFVCVHSERRADDNPIVCVGVGQPQRRRPVRHKHPGQHTHRALQHVRPRLVQRRYFARREHVVPDRDPGDRGQTRFQRVPELDGIASRAPRYHITRGPLSVTRARRTSNNSESPTTYKYSTRL